MSDLLSSLLRARTSKLPAIPPWSTEHQAEPQDNDDGQEEARDTFDAPRPASQLASLASRERTGRRTKAASNAFSPLTAEAYFDEALEVDVPLASSSSSSSNRESGTISAKFRVYYTAPHPGNPTSAGQKASNKRKTSAPFGGPSVSLQDISLSAAAMASLDVADDDDEAESGGEATESAGPGTLFVFHHGAGFSALSYALTAAEITRNTNGEAGVLAFDCRGHGRTKLSGATLPLDMSLSTLSNDLVSLLRSMFPDPSKMPSLVLVGHSMGGSVVVSASEILFRSGFTRISGVAVLDVVEGTAMDALDGMRSVVLGHPRGFDSVEQAIEWHVDSKTIANSGSARISVPPLVERDVSVPDMQDTDRHEANEDPIEVLDDSSDEATRPSERPHKRYRYRWRADLLATEPHWRSWFQGLSARFLGVKTARLLLLAGTDRLDRELMIGQMQGKYQLAVIPDVGHCLQEDAPDKTASVLVDFWRRNDRVKLPFKGIKKVGEA